MFLYQPEGRRICEAIGNMPFFHFHNGHTYADRKGEGENGTVLCCVGGFSALHLQYVEKDHVYNGQVHKLENKHSQDHYIKSSM